MTKFEKQILNDLQEYTDLSDIIDFLWDNNYELIEQSEEYNQPAKLELYFAYCGEEKTSGDGTLDLYVFVDETVFGWYRNEDEEYDEFVEAFYNQDWDQIGEHTIAVIPNIWNDGEMVYLGTDKKTYKKLMDAYTEWVKK